MIGEMIIILVWYVAGVLRIIVVGAIWLSSNLMAALRTIVSKTEFEYRSFNGIDQRIGVWIEEPQFGARSDYQAPYRPSDQSWEARQRSQFPFSDSVDPKTADLFEKTFPYLSMTDQLDDFVEGGWHNVDLNKTPWD